MTEKGRPPVILVVDDEPANIAVICRALRDEGEVRFALSGPAALEVMAAEPCPSLVLLDIMMPVMSGFDVCSALKARPAWRQVPVVFVTALAETAAELRALDTGAVDFITKPFDTDVLRERSRTHMWCYLNLEQTRRRELRMRGFAGLAADVVYEWTASDDRLRCIWPDGATDTFQRGSTPPRISADRDLDALTWACWLAGVEPADRANVAALTDAREIGDDRVVEVQYAISADGGEQHLYRDRVRPLRDDSGAQVGVIGACVGVPRT